MGARGCSWLRKGFVEPGQGIRSRVSQRVADVAERVHRRVDLGSSATCR